MNAFTSLSLDGSRHQARVGEAMHWGLVSCAPEASLSTVAELMSRERVHCVVVTDEPSDARSLWGVISDLDLVAAASVRGLDDQKAGATAMTPAISVAPSEPLEHAASLMTRYAVAHLVVIDPTEQRPLGVLSTLDIADALAAD